MAALTAQFEKACSNVEPPAYDVSDAASAHAAIRQVLEDDETLTRWGIETALIGSYDRKVSIHRIKDVDVFCMVEDLPDDVEPQALVDAVYDALEAEYGSNRVSRQARSVKVTFPEFGELYVDAAPARRADANWEIPQRNDDTQPWALTNPQKMADLSTAMNKDHDDRYVPVVKLIRQARRAILGLGQRPGGFWFEMAFYQACISGQVRADGNLAQQFTDGLVAIADLIDSRVDKGVDLPNPAVDGEVITIKATDKQWEAAQKKMREAADDAQAALDSTDLCAAARTFQALLGSNDDHDPVFPTPDYCNDDGTTKAASSGIVAGDRHVPAGNRRFG